MKVSPAKTVNPSQSVLSAGRKIRVLIADDTALYRKILTMAVEQIEGAEIIGSAPDGQFALDILKTKPADLVLLDVCMPRMDGVEALREINKLYPDTAVVMFSGVTTADADTTVEALEIGALEFIPKPKTKSLQESMESLSVELKRIIRLLKVRTLKKRTSSPGLGMTSRAVGEKTAFAGSHGMEGVEKLSAPRFDSERSLIVVGVSTGGPNALNSLVTDIPEDIDCPILIVQHMPPFFTASLATFLSKKTKLTVKEAEDGEVIKNGTIYIAPGGKHMVIEKDRMAPKGFKISTNEEEPVNSCRPAVDVLFDSVARRFDGTVLSLILTGMGEDGADGVQRLRSSVKGYTLVQDEESSVVYGMPRAVVERNLTDEVLPLNEIGGRIGELFQKGR